MTYAPANTGENLTGLPAETEVDALPCGGSNPNGASAPGSGQVNALTTATGKAQSNIVSDTRTFYDDPTLATTWPQPASPAWPQATPTTGDVSVVRPATGYSGGTFSYQTKSATVYDSYGRAVKSYDGNGGCQRHHLHPERHQFHDGQRQHHVREGHEPARPGRHHCA